MPPTRAEESRLQVRTLLIASLASLAAALVVSQFWINGTPIAAALTPVIVAIVSEVLNRPTEAIAKRVTTERTALLPQAMGAGAPDEHPEDEQETGPVRDLEGEPAPVRVYRSPQRRGWGRIHPKVVAVTAALAFVIAAAALTLPELIAGQSLGKGDRNTTIFGGRDRDRDEPEAEPREQPAPQATQPEEEPPPDEDEPQPTVPQEQPTAPTETAPLTVPTVPEQPQP
jgi:hypothetical protein